jgi:protein kinase C substrate 80K-H
LTNNIFWADILQHGSVSKDGITAEAGTVDELPQESAAPTLEKVIY